MNKIIEALQNMKNNYKVINNLMYLLKWGNFILLCVIFTLPYYNFLKGTSIERLPLFDEKLQSLFSWNVTTYIFFGLVGGGLLIFLRKCCIDISVKIDNNTPMIFYNISEDLVGLISFFFFLMKFTNDILCYVHSIDIFTIQNQYFYIIYFLYCIFLFLKFLYRKYKIFWYYTDRNYLPYFDSTGIQIADDDKVIFYGCLYEIARQRNTSQWVLKSNIRSISSEKQLLLQDAVKDKDGEIKIYSKAKNRKHLW